MVLPRKHFPIFYKVADKGERCRRVWLLSFSVALFVTLAAVVLQFQSMLSHVGTLFVCLSVYSSARPHLYTGIANERPWIRMPNPEHSRYYDAREALVGRARRDDAALTWRHFWYWESQFNRKFRRSAFPPPCRSVPRFHNSKEASYSPNLQSGVERAVSAGEWLLRDVQSGGGATKALLQRQAEPRLRRSRPGRPHDSPHPRRRPRLQGDAAEGQGEY